MPVGHEDERGLGLLDRPLKPNPCRGRQATPLAVAHAGDVEDHDLEEPRADEGRHCRSPRRGSSVAVSRPLPADRATRGGGRGPRRRRRRKTGRSGRGDPRGPPALPARVVRASRPRTRPVRPEEAAPWISETSPRGKPPPRSASTSAWPVVTRRPLWSSPRSGGASAWSFFSRRRACRAAFVVGRAWREESVVAIFSFAFSSLMIGCVARTRQDRKPCGREEARHKGWARVEWGRRDPSWARAPWRDAPRGATRVSSGAPTQTRVARTRARWGRTVSARRACPAGFGWSASGKRSSGWPDTPARRSGTRSTFSSAARRV